MKAVLPLALSVGCAPPAVVMSTPTPGAVEVSVLVEPVVEVATRQAEPAAWTNEASDLNLKAIRKHLAELERQHLAAVHTDDATAALADFAHVLPEGFEVTESTDRTLQARRIVT